MTLRRLLPDPGETSVADEIAALDLVSLAHDGRPYVVTNFVLTLDGRSTLHGRSGPIGSETDTTMLVALRTRVDAVMIGAGTMRAERYGRPVADPAKRERREREGLPRDPLMVLLSGRLDLPWEAPLFTAGEGTVVIWTTAAADPPPTATRVLVERFEHAVDLAAGMERLRSAYGVRALLCEGGARTHAQLLEAGLVDELFVTHAPKLGGGHGPTLVTDLPEAERPLDLAWLLHDPGSAELFARYRVL